MDMFMASDYVIDWARIFDAKRKLLVWNLISGTACLLLWRWRKRALLDISHPLAAVIAYAKEIMRVPRSVISSQLTLSNLGSRRHNCFLTGILHGVKLGRSSYNRVSRSKGCSVFSRVFFFLGLGQTAFLIISGAVGGRPSLDIKWQG